MIKLKSYRPFVTENLSWDFPSRYKLKSVSEFLQTDLADTTKFISLAAKQTMSNQAVYWFVEVKDTHQVMALIELTKVNFAENSASICVTTDKNIFTEFLTEISERLFSFINDQINLSSLEIENIPSNISKFFTSNGYTLNNKTLRRK